MTSPKVSILMGSDSDFATMDAATGVLEQFGVPYEVTVSSAHRSPERTVNLVQQAESKGVEIFIIGAGAAAHLAGVVAAHTILPVIGVPIDATSLRGVDALYSTVMMPGGIPVASMAIGKAGAKNAGLFAVAILATKDAQLSAALKKYRADMAAGVEKKAEALQAKLDAR